MDEHLRRPEVATLSAEQALANVRQLFAQLQQLTNEVGRNRHSAAYAELEAQIRMWADRYTKISAVRGDG
jgi:hypothetical protein